MNNINELIGQMLKHPVDTPKHKEFLNKIRKVHKANGTLRDEYVAVVHRDDFQEFIKILEDVDTLGVPIASNSIIKFVKRSQAEYNLKYIQIIASLAVVDNHNNILLIKESPKRISLPGGHVNYNGRRATNTWKSYLISEAMREFNEEVSISPKLPLKDFTLCYEPFDDGFTGSRTLSAMTHYGVTFMTTVDSLNSYEINAREDGTVITVQNVKSVNSNIIHKYNSMGYDRWVKTVISKLNLTKD